MKRGQSEYIGIILMILVIMMFALFNKVGSQRTQIQTAAEVVQQYRALSVTKAANTIPYVTTNPEIGGRGVPLADLMGAYLCYSDPPGSGGSGGVVKTPEYKVGAETSASTLQTTLDEVFGENKWALIISKKKGGGVRSDSPGLKMIGNPSFSWEGDPLARDGDFLTYEFILPLPCQFTDLSVQFADRPYYGLLIVNK